MTDRYGDRFDPARYADEEPVAITWADRTLNVPESLFIRVQYLARAYKLHLLPVIDIYVEETRLNQQQAATLSEELMFLRNLVNDAALCPYLDTWIALALACARTARPSYLTIDGP